MVRWDRLLRDRYLVIANKCIPRTHRQWPTIWNFLCCSCVYCQIFLVFCATSLAEWLILCILWLQREKSLLCRFVWMKWIFCVLFADSPRSRIDHKQRTARRKNPMWAQWTKRKRQMELLACFLQFAQSHFYACINIPNWTTFYDPLPLHILPSPIVPRYYSDFLTGCTSTHCYCNRTVCSNVRTHTFLRFVSRACALNSWAGVSSSRVAVLLSIVQCVYMRAR